MVQNKTVIAKMLKNLALFFSGEATHYQRGDRTTLPTPSGGTKSGTLSFDSYLIQQVLDLDMPMIDLPRTSDDQ